MDFYTDEYRDSDFIRPTEKVLERLNGQVSPLPRYAYDAIVAFAYSCAVHMAKNPNQESIGDMLARRDLRIPVVLEPYVADGPKLWTPFALTDRLANAREFEQEFLSNSSAKTNTLMMLRIRHFNDYSFARVLQSYIKRWEPRAKIANRYAELIDMELWEDLSRVFSPAYWHLEPADAICRADLSQKKLEEFLLQSSFSVGYVKTILYVDMKPTFQTLPKNAPQKKEFPEAVAAGFAIRFGTRLANPPFHLALLCGASLPAGVSTEKLAVCTHYIGEEPVLNGRTNIVSGVPFVSTVPTVTSETSTTMEFEWKQQSLDDYQDAVSAIVAKNADYTDTTALAALTGALEFLGDSDIPSARFSGLQKERLQLAVSNKMLAYIKNSDVVSYYQKYKTAQRVVMAVCQIEVAVLPSAAAQRIITLVLSGQYNETEYTVNYDLQNSLALAEAMHCLARLNFCHHDIVQSLHRLMVSALLAMRTAAVVTAPSLSSDPRIASKYRHSVRYGLKRLMLCSDSVPHLQQWCVSMDVLLDTAVSGTSKDSDEYTLDSGPRVPSAAQNEDELSYASQAEDSVNE